MIQQSREEILEIFREAMRDHGNVRVLANYTGLSTGCLYRIRSGKTKWPQWVTIETLMVALRIRMVVQKY